MGFFNNIKHDVSKSFNKTTSEVKKSINKGLNNLKHSSFRDSLVAIDRRPADLRKAVGVNTLQDTTFFEQLEDVSGNVERGTNKIANIKGIRHIPILGSVVGEVNTWSSEIHAGAQALNKAIDEQDRASKTNKGASIHNYANIGKAGIQAGRKMNKLHKKVESESSHMARLVEGSSQTSSRHDEVLVM